MNLEEQSKNIFFECQIFHVVSSTCNDKFHCFGQQSSKYPGMRHRQNLTYISLFQFCGIQPVYTGYYLSTVPEIYLSVVG